MNDPKPFASLGATLLARKGGARPAMRPQFATMGALGVEGAKALSPDSELNPDLEDLGWNDMGHDEHERHEANVLQLTPAPTNLQTEAKARADDELARHELAEAELDDEELEEEPSESDWTHADWTGANEVDEDEDEPVETDFGAAAPAAEEPAVLHQQRVLAEKVATPSVQPEEEDTTPLKAKARAEAVSRPRARRNAAEHGRRAAFTLRLDAQRHLKLRLAATMRNRSAQQLVTEALDQFLADLPELDSLAAQFPRNAKHG